MTFKEFRRFKAASMAYTQAIFWEERMRKQAQPFHIFDLPTNLDTGFYE
jgi:hypothetical protein